MIDRVKIRAVANGSLTAQPSANDGIRIHGFFEVECYDADGNLKWRDAYPNTVVNTGLDYLLDAGLSGATPVTTWYLGLTDGTPTVAAADTMASHAGWTEVTAYSEAVRQTWTEAGVSSQSITNSASKAVFSINGTTTAGGTFLTSDSTKSGTSGTLFGAAAFSEGDRSLVNTDTLNVTYTVNAS